MYSFIVSIHARPPSVCLGEPVLLDGVQVRPAAVESSQLADAFSVSFDEACQRLSRLARMYCEPDGSFVWVGEDAGRPWQVDGNLYEGPAGLMYVEVSGSCPAGEFDRLLQCFGWPETELLFQITRKAVYLDEGEWRRWAAR